MTQGSACYRGRAAAGYSVGLSSRELAGYLLTLGIKDAAMLDGGASTR